MKKYNNTKATLAIAKASFRSIIRSPSAVVFSLAFPLIFIIVFANIGGGAVKMDVGVAKTSDTSKSDSLYQHLARIPVIHLVKDQSAAEMQKNLSKGNIDAIIDVKTSTTSPYYTLNIQYTTASAQKDGVLRSLLNSMFFQINSRGNTAPQPIAELKESTIHGREYKYIDFLLPGMLGFSLLSSGIFVDRGPVYHPCWPLLFRLYADPWRCYRDQHADPFSAWPHCIYGFWIYHLRRCQKRKRGAAAFQHYHDAAVFTVGYFFCYHRFSGLAAVAQ